MLSNPSESNKYDSGGDSESFIQDTEPSDEFEEVW